MSESSSNASDNNGHLPSSDESKVDTLSEKRKLSLSHSENTFDNQSPKSKQKPLAKVKSWSSKEHHLKDECINVELDLAKSLTKLEVVESNDDIGSNLLRARDSLDNLLKDEQNMPKSSLERSMFHPKPRNMPESPKSSPQLGENWKACSSKVPFWDPYDRQGKKSRKDMRRKNKNKSADQCRNEAGWESRKDSSSKHGEEVRSVAETSGINLESSTIEEENFQKYKYMAKNSKSVVFTNEVLVVYFNNEDVVGEEKEPLKKEIEQQTRNKEMRRIHLNKTQEKYNLCLF